MGKTFGELQFYLPWATVYGLVQYATRRCVLNPPPDTRVENLDELIVIRATDLREHEVVPLAEPVRVDPGALTSHFPAGSFATAILVANPSGLMCPLLARCCTELANVIAEQNANGDACSQGCMSFAMLWSLHAYHSGCEKLAIIPLMKYAA